MSFARPSKEELAAFESRVDQHFARTPVPCQDRVHSLWHFLTAAEDLLRLPDSSGHNEHAMLIGNSVSTTQRGVQHILACHNLEGRLSNELIDDAAYLTASRLYQRCSNYELAVTAFGAFHGGQASAVISESHSTVRFACEAQFSGYEAFGALSSKSPRQTAIGLLSAVLRQSCDLPPIFERIARRTKRVVVAHRADVTYRLVPALFNELAQLLPAHAWLLPADWHFPWATAKDSLAIYHALSTRCLYHLIAVHFGSSMLNVVGLGFDRLVFVPPKHELRRELRSLASVTSAVLDSTLSALTYGRGGLNTPDMALQPILAIDEGRYLIACSHLLALDPERNMLALHARLNKKTFDAQSSVFERMMVANATSAFAPTAFVVRGNVRISAEGASEELDLVVVDMREKLILVAELRWMIRPGSMREVVRRREDCLSKVKQLARKLEFCRSARQRLLERLELEQAGAEEWTVEGVVVLDGFAGGPAGFEAATPILPLTIFISGVLANDDLREAWRQWRSLDWLPREGKEYTMVNATADFGDVRIAWSGIAIPDGIPSADKAIADSLSRVRIFAMTRNLGLKNPQCIAALLPYDMVFACTDHTDDLRDVPRDVVLGSRLITRLRETSQQLVLIDATVHVACLEGEAQSVARRIEEQMTLDRAHGVVRKPRGYYLPDAQGIAVAVVVSDEFWTPHW